MKKINFKTIFCLTILLSVIFVASCKPGIVKGKETANDAKINELATTQELKKFSSTQEVLEFLKKASVSQSVNGAFYGGTGGVRSMAASQLMESAAPQAKAADTGTASSEYSQTNIQVAGVDEADFVKNDDKYIYVITQDKLVIVNAYPAENAKILSTTKLDGNPRDMFVNKDRLVVFVEGSDQTPVFAQYDFVPRPRYVAKMHAYVYDISDKEKPKLVKDYNLKGSYYQSRMIGDYVYFIVTDNVYYSGDLIDLPVIKEASNAIIKPEIYYFDNPEMNYNFNTVASFNIFGLDDKMDAKTFMMGYANNLYVSQNNIYITYQKNLPYSYYEAHNEERFYDVVVPLLPSDAQSKIDEIKKDNTLNSYEKWDKISNVLEEVYNKMDDSDKEKLVSKISDAIEEYEAKLEAERRKTVIHKIKIENGKINYGTRGEVPGYVLNQFSMDEYQNHFRVATTMEFYGRIDVMPMYKGAAGGSGASGTQAGAVSGQAVADSKMAIMPRTPIQKGNVMYNNVYVLDDNLKTVGKLEAVAPDERIYSARFLGDRLYMVTFKRIDPLFVIDLSKPENPEILGKLKIPGFSDYLHPYDENHIIGIGKETEANDWGGISTNGVKVALFDVSDVSNPKQLDKYEIGDAGTDSEALRDHKAFLFDKKKNLLALPVTEVKSKLEYDPKLGYYRQNYWQGAYVFSVSLEEGFKVKGKITHNEGYDSGYWWDSQNVVRRALYMDDVLYTVSAGRIKANDLNNIDKEIKEIKMPYEEQKYYPNPAGFMETAVE